MTSQAPEMASVSAAEAPAQDSKANQAAESKTTQTAKQ